MTKNIITVLASKRRYKLIEKSPTKAKKLAKGYGKCSKCSCPGFQGNGSACSRSGCGHHYDDHW